MMNLPSFFPWEKFREQFGISLDPSKLLSQEAIQKYVEEEISRSFSNSFNFNKSEATSTPFQSSQVKPGWSIKESDQEVTLEKKLSKGTSVNDIRLQMNPTQLLIHNTNTNRKQQIPLPAAVFPKSARATIQDRKLRIVMRKQSSGTMHNIDIQML